MTEADQALDQILQMEGASAVAIVETSTGMMLASKNSSSVDLELAAAVNVEVVKAKQRAIEQLGLNEQIEDILITLTHQYYLIRMAQRPELQGTFLYLILDRAKGNLALARRALATLEEAITL